MAPSATEVAVFTDTNLGTRFAVDVPRDIAAGALKKELGRVHFHCFPEFGEILVYGLMVKQRSHFYHLPETVLLSSVLQGVKGAWFLHVQVKSLSQLSKPYLQRHLIRKVGDHISDLSNATYSLASQSCLRSTCENKNEGNNKKLKRNKLDSWGYMVNDVLEETVFPLNKKKKRKTINRRQLVECMENELEKGNPSKDEGKTFNEEVEAREERNSSCIVEATSEVSTEVVSVAGIIRRYFPSLNEESSCSGPSSKANMITSRDIPSRGEEGRKKKAESSHAHTRDPKVGKRLVTASYDLGFSPSKQRPEIYLCSYRDRNSPELSSLPKISTSVFEISDREED